MSAGVEDAKRGLLKFDLSRAPFGGCDDEVFPTFGEPARKFYQRVLGILLHDPAPRTSTTGSQLAELCRQKTIRADTGIAV